MSVNRTALAIAALAVGATACSDDGPTAIEIPLAQVEIITPCPTVDEGATCQMTARGITAEGAIVTNAVLRWSSSAGSVAQVDDDGRVFGVGPGQAVITVEAAFGEGSDTAAVFVFPCTTCT